MNLRVTILQYTILKYYGFLFAKDFLMIKEHPKRILSIRIFYKAETDIQDFCGEEYDGASYMSSEVVAV